MRGAVPECLPRAMLERLDLPDRETALREVHFPPEGTPFAQLQSCGDAGASAADLRGTVFSGAGSGTEAAAHEGARRHRLRHQRQGARGDPRGASLSSHDGAEAGAGRDCGRHARAQPHAAAAAGRCGLGQDDCRVAGHAGGHGERLPGGADGAHGDSGHAAFSGGAQAAGTIVAQAAHRAADRLARRGPQAATRAG